MAEPVALHMDELVEEILLRFPPDDPARLLNAALVCKRWCRLITDCGFHHRFRKHHRTPWCWASSASTEARGPTSHPPPRSPCATPTTAAVLHASSPSGASTCDHLDCRREPFLVVLMGTSHVEPYALAGNALYFMAARKQSIRIPLKYKFDAGEISRVNILPYQECPVLLTETEYGGLGFAALKDSQLHLWSRDDGPSGHLG
ncbi:hypothetical protein SETIT_2G104600v2 [Setaria italica]|uniref:F-box domain-containing protein n=2 Tax=Setaria italica TaxID=4555 RepID=A0A368PXH1_SETIT|nr:hypothetical protein SETIT_2G104600v2 [Setaria italica]